MLANGRATRGRRSPMIGRSSSGVVPQLTQEIPEKRILHVIIAGGDHPNMNRLAASLQAAGSLEVVGVEHDADDLVASSARLRPDAVVIDVDEFGRSGLETLDQIKALDPSPHIVVVARPGSPSLRPLAESGNVDAYVTSEHAATVIDVVLGLAAS
jgi:DNA-binding NarL/FixJ family response regulator